MVQAILEGRKKMTRRIIKPQPDDDGLWNDTDAPRSLQSTLKGWNGSTIDGQSMEFKCRYGRVGDILWIRESFQPVIRICSGTGQLTGSQYSYKADIHNPIKGHDKFKPSIHMPYAACRIWLKIKSIRVERLQDISTEDILSEGVRYGVSPKENNMAAPIFKLQENSALSFMPDGWQRLSEDQLKSALLRAHWFELWCEINGIESWNSNPWTWRIEFERTEKP